MVSQEVSKCQGSGLLLATDLHNVNVMSVGPLHGAMEEGAERIVLMRNMNIPHPLKRDSVCVHGLKGSNRYLDVDDRLSSQPRHRCGAIVLDPSSNVPQDLR